MGKITRIMLNGPSYLFMWSNRTNKFLIYGPNAASFCLFSSPPPNTIQNIVQNATIKAQMVVCWDSNLGQQDDRHRRIYINKFGHLGNDNAKWYPASTHRTSDLSEFRLHFQNRWLNHLRSCPGPARCWAS